jgi:hypothetical protein
MPSEHWIPDDPRRSGWPFHGCPRSLFCGGLEGRITTLRGCLICLQFKKNNWRDRGLTHTFWMAPDHCGERGSDVNSSPRLTFCNPGLLESLTRGCVPYCLLEVQTCLRQGANQGRPRKKALEGSASRIVSCRVHLASVTIHWYRQVRSTIHRLYMSLIPSHPRERPT